MQSTPDTRTPNERLAEIIADALVVADLVLPARFEELKRKVAAGAAKAEDWSHWIESARRDADRFSKPGGAARR